MALIVPKIALANLASLRGRERLCHAAWGLVRWLTLLVGLLALSTFIDWRIDKFRETPFWLRTGLSLIQLVILAFAGWHWLLKPWVIGPSLIKLARRAEESYPEFGHRLVTAIQLNKPDADTRGMSPQLIENLTREAEEMAGRHRFTALADHRRLKWAGALLTAPCVVLTIITLLYGADLLKVLIDRQLFAKTDIPRFNQLENITPLLWPAGDEVIVEYAVAGRVREDEPGRARIKPENLPADEYELQFTRRLDDGRAVFMAKVPHSSVNFSHRAWIGDGRTKDASEVQFEARPVITRTDAWVQLPKFLGTRPDGKPYETYQSQGDIAGLAGSAARVRVCTQKPLSEATLILIGRGGDGTAELIRRTERMLLRDEEQTPEGAAQFPAEVTFDLTPDLIAYRVEARDVNGFANATPPRRGILLAPDEAPMVRLLQERYAAELGGTASEEDVIDGLPIPLGGQIPVAYTTRSPQGVSRGVLRYRINEAGPWLAFPLTTTEETEKSGPFNPLTGAFKNSGFGEQVQFHPAKSSDRETTPDYLTGGGRFDFQTAQLTKVTEDGKTGKLEIGDRVEFYVEVYDRNPNPARDGKPRPAGKSETRLKEILSASDVLMRLDQTRQAEGKIRDIELKQRNIFGVPLAPGKK